jgi:PAS domain S-box-containing protein
MVESAVQLPAGMVVDSTEKVKIRVLHVDDEPALLKIAKQCLEMQGPFQVDTAGSAEEALAKLEKTQYDAVISDYQMTGKDGLVFLKELRQKLCSIPFIMFTGKGREEVAVKAWSLGADHYVNKSGDPETVYSELAHCVQSSVEKRVAEAQIRETLQKLQTIYQNAIEGISYVDVEENIVYANKAFADIVGYSQDQLAGMNLRKIVDDESWAKIRSMTERRRLGEAGRYEAAFRRSDGAVQNVLISSAPLLNHEGKFAGTVGIVLDMTDRKKAEDALRASEERHRIISSITVGFAFSCAKKGGGQFALDWITGATERMLGYSNEEVREKGSWKYVVQKQDLPTFEEKVTGLKPSQSSLCELRITHKDGSTRWIKVWSRVMEDTNDPATYRLFGAAEDITESKKNEELMKESEERFRSLFESIQDPVCIYVGKEGHLTDYNPAFKRLFGYTDEELKDKVFLDFVHPDDQAMVLKKYQTRYPPEEFPIVYEIRVINRKGETIPVEISVSAYEKKGRIIGIEVTHRDITERKRYEKRLSALNTYSRNLNMAESMREIYSLTLDAMQKVLGFEYADFFMIEESVLRIIDQRGYPEPFTLELPLDGSKKGISVKAVKTGNSVIVPDVRNDVDFVEGLPGTLSELAVPIKIGQETLGVLNVESKNLDAFDEKDQALLEILASHAATAISNLEHAENLAASAREIRESKQRFERLFMDNPEAVVYLDPDLHILDVNPRFAELFGYPLGEVKGKCIDNFVVPEDKMEEAKMLGREFMKGYTYYDTVRKKKDGSLVSVSISGGPVTVEGKVIGTLALYKDITEMKHYEASLSALNAYSRNLNTAKNMEEIYKLTLDAAEKTLGFEFADILIMKEKTLCLATHLGYSRISSLELPLDGDKGITVRAARTGKPVLVPDISKEEAYVEGGIQTRSELAVPIKIGHRVIGVLNAERKEVNAFHEKDQQLLEILASHAATAISNLEYAKNLEASAQEIRESQQKFEGLFMANPEAAVHVGPDVCILNVNPRFEMLFGYKLDEIKGKNINDVVVPKDKIDEALMLDRIAEHEKHVSQNTVRRRKDGSLVPVFVSSAPITVEGRFLGYVAVYKDISELKDAEKKLELMNEKLRVTGGLTRHDVRNKLSTITGNVYLLNKRLSDNSDVLDKLKAIESAVQQTVRIFDFAKAYEMLGVEELSYIDVAKTLDEAVSLFLGSINVKVVNECSGLVVLADPLLRQLFYNLIDNSLKYGQKVSRIRVYYEGTGLDNLSLVYEDDGVGIPATEKPKLFKQGYSTGGSTGYGLYLISKIVEVYGWTIQETGTLGKGAQFTIAIPKLNRDGKESVRLS